jgi:hypothetical protein
MKEKNENTKSRNIEGGGGIFSNTGRKRTRSRGNDGNAAIINSNCVPICHMMGIEKFAL